MITLKSVGRFADGLGDPGTKFVFFDTKTERYAVAIHGIGTTYDGLCDVINHALEQLQSDVETAPIAIGMLVVPKSAPLSPPTEAIRINHTTGEIWLSGDKASTRPRGRRLSDWMRAP